MRKESQSRSPARSAKNDSSVERMAKMRDIKSEIGELMSKIDNASKQIYDSYIHKKHEFTLNNPLN